MKNTLIFTYGTNILVRLLTVNMQNCLTPKNPKFEKKIRNQSINKMKKIKMNAENEGE